MVSSHFFKHVRDLKKIPLGFAFEDISEINFKIPIKFSD